MSRLAIAFLAAGVSACATTPASTIDAFAARTAVNSFELRGRSVDPPAALVLPLIHDRQIEGSACGAHALASITNYWQGEQTASGAAIYAASPPADLKTGYSMAEILALAENQGLMASAVRLPEAAILRELEAGRPVLVPVSLPSVFVQGWQLPGANIPVLGIPAAVITSRSAHVSELTGQGMVNHYILMAGYEGDTFITLEPVMGLRTISASRLARYREPFGNAAIVFSATPAQD